MEDIKALCEQWVAIKEQERETVAWRREIEDKITQRLKLDEIIKNTTKKVEGFKITASVRNDIKVDVQHVRELAAEHGINDKLADLFRWDAKVNSRAWAQSDPAITDALEPAIERKLSRSTIKIEQL